MRMSSRRFSEPTPVWSASVKHSEISSMKPSSSALPVSLGSALLHNAIAFDSLEAHGPLRVGAEVHDLLADRRAKHVSRDLLGVIVAGHRHRDVGLGGLAGHTEDGSREVRAEVALGAFPLDLSSSRGINLRSATVWRTHSSSRRQGDFFADHIGPCRRHRRHHRRTHPHAPRSSERCKHCLGTHSGRLNEDSAAEGRVGLGLTLREVVLLISHAKQFARFADHVQPARRTSCRKPPSLHPRQRAT